MMNDTERLKADSPAPLLPQPPDMQALAAEIEAEYRRRRRERQGLELKWRLNQRFLAGDQYCDVAEGLDELIEGGADRTGRAVYNMIAPIEETRLSKLERATPSLTVRPQTDEAADVTAARTATKLLKTAFDTLGMPRLQAEAARWAELCGSAFYKSVWDPRAGLPLGVTPEGETVREGDIAVSVAPAYEIFPECCWRDGLESQNSLIHARVYTVSEIRARWGVSLSGRTLNVYGAESAFPRAEGPFVPSETLQDAELVLEYYRRPDGDFPQGRHVTVAGGRVLHTGPLPFRNGECGGRDFPFVQQLCLSAPGCFFGGTVIERLIPLQRDYNAVINRINEHTARMTAGNILAEQGSLVDETLLDEGFEPGTVIEYRPGTTPPSWLRVSEVPVTLLERLALLRRDFIEISGVSEMARASSLTGPVSSGIALDILREQDDTRIALTGRHIRRAIQLLGRQWLRLLREFAVAPRITRTAGGDAGDMALIVWTGSDLSSDDIAVDTDAELSSTPAQRRQLALELMRAGLFLDPDTHQLSRENRARLLEIFQFGHWETVAAVDELHRTRARREQLELLGGAVPSLMSVDCHELHIAEHTRFALGAEFRRLQQEQPALAQALIMHIEGHRALQGNPGIT